MFEYQPYLTPAHAGVYIGSLHIDDVYAIQYEEQDSTAPIYSCFEREWVRAAVGKRIVSGYIAINFRYPGYLATAIRLALEDSGGNSSIDAAKADAFLKNGSIIEWHNKMQTVDADERLSLLADAAKQGEDFLRKASALSYLASVPYLSTDPPNTRRQVEDILNTQKTEFNDINAVDIWIHYDTQTRNKPAERIVDVVFTGNSKELQAGAIAASGGVSVNGANLFEVYPFFAKRIEQYYIT